MDPFIISGKESLLLLISNYKSKITGKIIVQIDQLDAWENAQYEKQFNDWHHACGCDLGAAFCFVTIFGYLALSLIKSSHIDWLLFRNGLIYLFVAALSGKIIGLTVARFQLRRTVKALAKKLG